MQIGTALYLAALVSGKYDTGRKLRIIVADAQGLPAHYDVPVIDEDRLEQDVQKAMDHVRESFQI